MLGSLIEILLCLLNIPEKIRRRLRSGQVICTKQKTAPLYAQINCTPGLGWCAPEVGESEISLVFPIDILWTSGVDKLCKIRQPFDIKTPGHCTS